MAAAGLPYALGCRARASNVAIADAAAVERAVSLNDECLVLGEERTCCGKRAYFQQSQMPRS